MCSLVSLWEGITMRVIAGSIPPGYNSKLVAPDKDGKAQMIKINKEDQILPAFQIVTKSR